MNLYVWESKCLETLGPGHIIAAGNSVEDARVNARAGIERYIAEDYNHLSGEALLRGYPQEMRAELLAEIEAEPEVIDAICLPGEG